MGQASSSPQQKHHEGQQQQQQQAAAAAERAFVPHPPHAPLEQQQQRPQQGIRLYRRAGGTAAAAEWQLCSVQATAHIYQAAPASFHVLLRSPEAGVLIDQRADGSLCEPNALLRSVQLTKSSGSGAGAAAWRLTFPCPHSFAGFAAELEDAVFYNAFGSLAGRRSAAPAGASPGDKRRAWQAAGAADPGVPPEEAQLDKRQRLAGGTPQPGSSSLQQQQQQQLPPSQRGDSMAHAASSSGACEDSEASSCVARLTFHDSGSGLSYCFAVTVTPGSSHTLVVYKSFNYSIARGDGLQAFCDVIDQVCNSVLSDLQRARCDDSVAGSAPDGSSYECELLLARPRLASSRGEPTAEEVPDLLLQTTFAWRDTPTSLQRHLRPLLWLRPSLG